MNEEVAKLELTLGAERAEPSEFAGDIHGDLKFGGRLMERPLAVIFGAVVAYILLLLYAVTTVFMLRELLICAGDSTCASRGPDFNDGIIFVVTTVGGLVSALVISTLAVAKPGKSVAGTFGMASASKKQILTVNTLSALYLVVWLAVGLGALIVGVMMHPDLSQTVSDLGTSWLGLAVASGYTYFGIDTDRLKD